MRNLIKTSALTIAGVLVAAGAAVAGDTSVYNKYEHEVITNGYTETNVTVEIENTIERVTDSLAIKA